MRARWIVLLVVASNLFTLALVFGVRGWDEYHRFDVAEWRAEEPGYCPSKHRGPMIPDLDDRILRVGLTKASLRSILGEPDERDARGWSYETGMAFSDCLMLSLYFDDDQLVEWYHRRLDD